MQRNRKLGHDKFHINFNGGHPDYLRILVFCVTLFTTVRCDNELDTIIKEIAENFILPYFQPMQYNKASIRRAKIESTTPKDTETTFHSPHSKIQEVVDHLKPFLQDDEIDIDSHEKDETAIIELLPNIKQKYVLRTGKSERDNVYKYEKIKSQIKSALQKEAVSEKTRRFVTKALDHLISQVLRDQCSWKDKNISSIWFRNSKQNITIQEWDELKTEYSNFLKNQSKTESRTPAVFKEFHKFFSKVINAAIQTPSSDKIRIRCQIVNENNSEAILRRSSACKDFKVCSKELSDFLQKMYETLNDTAVSAYRNYAAMYVREISDEDINYAGSVPNVIDNAASSVERRVGNTFKQEVLKLKLHPNKSQEANIMHIKDHVKMTVQNVLNHIKRHLPSDIASLSPYIRMEVEKDLSSNLHAEMRNLAKSLQERICADFLLCNGGVSVNRRFASPEGVKSNNVYVKLHSSIDDLLKEIARLFEEDQSIDDSKSSYDIKKSYQVTRTTLITTS